MARRSCLAPGTRRSKSGTQASVESLQWTSSFTSLANARVGRGAPRRRRHCGPVGRGCRA
eukprot:3605683-Prymnesium_polylepis.1